MILKGQQFSEDYAKERLQNSPLGLLVPSENKKPNIYFDQGKDDGTVTFLIPSENKETSSILIKTAPNSNPLGFLDYQMVKYYNTMIIVKK